MSRTATSIELMEYPQTPLTDPPNVHIKGDRASSLNDDGQPIIASTNAVDVEHLQAPGKRTTAIVLVTVVCVTMISAMLSGVTTVVLPTMARDLQLAPSCVLQSVFTLASGLSRTGTQLIVFRALGGIAISFCLPSAVSTITATFPEGKSRNIAFASMGGGQPIGFSLGLVLGGIFADTIGWRWGFHLCAIVNTIIFVIALFGLPKVADKQTQVFHRLRTEIDWGRDSHGKHLFSTAFLLLCIREATTLGLLITAIALIPGFIVWVGRQEKLGRPAVIPNSLWKNRIFSVICVGVFLVWGVFNGIETYMTLFFQDVQGLSALQTSIRFLPTPVGGIIANVAMGLIAHRVRADYTVHIGVFLATVAALLMCVIQPEWTYWVCAFPATFLMPIGSDVLYTISSLVITSVFPARTQGLAGGVFNTIAQIGKSVGLATSGVIATSITSHSRHQEKEGPEALMEGFRAAYWYLFALSCATAVLFAWGLRGIGKVGMKRE
ncbi:hypothetical protein SNOG_03037 [Parastagonospora nodorum SN15]|uniref:Major facilitator superfamily (MFS) profile domain-containing protein n=1 Tax=Phaeosphaeria nodorum (strain SN15 / ATCC MYA-4574 / FGSC 10173) TaxID=321614 RepID=Q0UYX7_PHANO|nr:hypothetical protein SNOG_03037 [Parastagonospora nodorum SN15]EAT89768.2 hypothetical protein SNOG_03037 [Parastagonospora nodorum SN15]